MDTKYFLTLKTILETGSFQKAAFKLNYTQSTVTFHIQQLEQELKLKLFDKIGRKMVLTQAGKDLLPHIEAVLSETEWIQNYGKDLLDLTGTLQVGMPDSLLCYKMQPLLCAYKERAPKVQLIIQSLSCYDIRDSVIKGSIDMGIHCNIGGYPNTIVEEELTSYYAVLAASSKENKQELDFTSPHQRKNINLINSDPHSLHHQRFLRYLEKKDIVLNTSIEMWSVEATKASVIAGLGIAYLPQFTIENELNSGILVPVKTELDSEPVPVVCTYHKNKWFSPALSLFKNMVSQSLKSAKQP